MRALGGLRPRPVPFSLYQAVPSVSCRCRRGVEQSAVNSHCCVNPVSSLENSSTPVFTASFQPSDLHFWANVTCFHYVMWLCSLLTLRHPNPLSFIERQHTDARYWYSKSVCLSVRPSVRYVPVLYENGLKYCHSVFSPHGSGIILVLPASNIFTKFRRGHPLRGR